MVGVPLAACDQVIPSLTILFYDNLASLKLLVQLFKRFISRFGSGDQWRNRLEAFLPEDVLDRLERLLWREILERIGEMIDDVRPCLHLPLSIKQRDAILLHCGCCLG